MLEALMVKEWLKLRRLAWVPPLLILAVLVDSGLVLRAIQNNHGSIQLWNMLTYKQDIVFDKLSYILPLCGLWYACVQYLPECIGKRLRLLFHLPISHRIALYVPVFVGLLCLSAVSLLTLGGLAITLSVFHLPVELSWPMVQTALPWCLSAVVAYLATAAALADPAWYRRLAIALCGLAFMTMLARTTTFSGMTAHLGWYGVLCLLWLFPLEAAALRVKEGR